MSIVFDGVGTYLRWFATCRIITCFCASSFVRMSLHFLMRLIPLPAASLTTVVSDDTDSSQNVLNTESSVHFIGGFLVSWETTRTCFAFLHESIKEGFLLLYRSFNFNGSDSFVILRGETSSIDDRCRLFTIVFCFCWDYVIKKW